MEYTNLGKTGLKVSKVILGAMSYGSDQWQDWVLPEATSLPLLHYAYMRGINTWDTADVYSMGRSEEIIGKAIRIYKIPRTKLVILTKCYFGVDASGAQPNITSMSTNDGVLVNQVGLSRKHIFDAVDASVARLGTYIDVLQIHRLDRSTPREEIMRALNDAVDSGKVRYIGASSMACWEFHTLQNIAETRGWHKFVSMQNYHNLLYREEEREMMPYCHDTGVGVIPWSPLARGALTRPWSCRDTFREQRDRLLRNLIRSRETEVDKEIVGRLQEVATRRGVSMACVATAWSIAKGCCPIQGLMTKERIDQAVEHAGYELSQEDVEYLDEPYVPKPVVGY